MDQEVRATSDLVTPDTPEGVDLPPEDSQAAFVRNTAVMSVGTTLSRVTGFLRLSAMAYALGITETRLADAYNIANITPNIVYELALGGILSSVFVPVFVQWLQSRGREAAWDVARRVLGIAAVSLSIISILGIALAPWIIRLYTVGVPDGQRQVVEELASFFLRWFMPQIVFYGIGAVATGLLNAHRRFAVPMFAPILNNLIVIATFLTFAAMSHPGQAVLATGPQKLVLAVGTTLGVMAMTVALWPSLRRLGFRFRWRPGWMDEAVIRIGHLAKWVVVYVVANQLGYLVVLILAARVKGGYTAYAAAFMLFQLPHAIFVVSVFTALLPALSSRWVDGDRQAFRELLARGIRWTAVIVVPAALGYLVLAVPIVRLLLQHGVAGPRSTDLVAGILVFFSLGLFSFSTFQLLLRAYYSMQDTRTPALVNIAAVGLNVVVDLLFVLVLGMGVRGLALGHATAYTFGSIALLGLIRRRLGGLDGRRIVSGLSRTFLAAGITAAVAWAAARAIGGWAGTATLGGQAAQVLGAVAVGILAFVAAALMLHVDEVDVLRRQLAARWRR
ncbi:MAG: murein biosynthesis integral membrane protein MurJ [Actinobacteria bacterium]|nr:MAG: murein biosynthesis integral membrane protein MurJ [Actinomycetota bacterium]